MPSRICKRLIATMAMASLAAAGFVSAQEQPAVPPGMEGFYGKESPQGVYVRDAAVALEKFPLAQRLERMREWGKAADVLQEVLEKYPDRVIQVGGNEELGTLRYVSVGTAIQQRIGKWPAEGLTAYRARFELPAQNLLESIRPDDVTGLRKLHASYFNTEPGKIAALRLINLAFRNGDFRSAAELADQLLAWHPLVDRERPDLLYRSALCAHLLGLKDRAAELLAQLQDQHANATGVIRGQDVVLADSLQAELALAPPVSHDPAGEDWPLFGGDLTRARVPDASAGTGARLFSIPLGPPDYSRLPEEQRPALAMQAENDRREGTTLGIMPVVDDGELFFQDGRRIYGVSLESGVPLPGWTQTHAGDAEGAYIAPDCTPLPPGQQLNVTVTDREVLAIMGFPDRPAPGALVTRSNALSRIVCLDRATGAEKWVARPQDLPEDEGALNSVMFSGSPLVIGDNVHILGRGGKGAQFEDCYLITFDLETGRHKWSTYIASSNTENMSIFGNRNAGSAGETTSHIAYASGRLLVATNLGVVAAVDAHTGTIDWLSIYQRNIANDPRQMRGFGRMQPAALPKPQTFNPVLVQDGHAFVLPTDSDDILIYNAINGELVKSIRRRHLEDPDTLIGVDGDRLLVSSDFRMYCISWSRYDPETFQPTNDEVLYWPIKFQDFGELVSPVRGRPFLTRRDVLVSTARRLERIDARTGRRIGSYPIHPDEWSASEGPGNVVVAGDRVILAGDRSVDVYTDLSLARAKLDAEVDAAPDDPVVRMRYAEMMFVAGQTPEALNRLDQAIELLGGRDRLQPGAGVDRLFTLALAFARKSESREREGDRDMAQAFYDRAAAAARSPAQLVNLHLSRARGALAAEDDTTVVAMYQRILSDPALRTVSLSDDEEGGVIQAAVLAEREIEKVITRSGRDSYATFDQAASQGLAQARGTDNPDDLLALARQYPNSLAAAEALTTAAERYEQAGNHRLATRTLRQVAHRYPDSFAAAEGLESMARNYLAIPNRVEVASSRLAYGVRTLDDPALKQPLPLPNGQTLPAGTPFSKALEALRTYTGEARSVDLPDFGLPDRAWTLKNPDRSPFDEVLRLPNIDALVRPQRQYERPDRIVTWSANKGLAVYAVGQEDPLGATDIVSDPPLDAAWLESGLLVAAPQQIVLLDPNTAAPRWVVRLADLPPAEFVRPDASQPAPVESSRQPEVVLGAAGPQRIRVLNNRVLARNIRILQPAAEVRGPEQFTQLHVTDDRVLATTSTGRLVALDLAEGKLAWQSRLMDGVPIDRITANSDFTVARTISESDVQLVVIDTYSGEAVSRRNFSRATGDMPVNFELAPDGMLVWATPDRLCGKDLYEPGHQLTWESEMQASNRRIFQGATEPDHLKIDDGRIMIVSNEGSNKRFVRLYSLETGRPIRYAKGPGGQEIDAPLQTEASGAQIRLFVNRPYLYAMSQKMLVAYNLDRPHETWRGWLDEMIPHNMTDVLIGQQHLLLLDASTPPAEGQAGIPSLTIYAYSRRRVEGVESGLLDHMATLRDPAGITAWQGVEGGLYYLSNDKTLHYHKGLGRE